MKQLGPWSIAEHLGPGGVVIHLADFTKADKICMEMRCGDVKEVYGWLGDRAPLRWPIRIVPSCWCLAVVVMLSRVPIRTAHLLCFIPREFANFSVMMFILDPVFSKALARVGCAWSWRIRRWIRSGTFSPWWPRFMLTRRFPTLWRWWRFPRRFGCTSRTM